MPLRSRFDNADRLTALLAGSAIGVYLLMVVGATTALLNGAGSCPTWPACHGQWLPALDDPGQLAAWSHRLATVAVGGLLVITALVAWRRGPDRRVRLGLGAALALFPVQIALGALTVVGGATTGLAAAHLAVAMGIFSGVSLALLGRLEALAPATDDTGSAVPETIDPGDGPQGGPGEQPPLGLIDRVRGYVSLTKPKLWWLLCLVAIAAMAMAAGPSLDAGLIVATTAGGVLAVAASGTFNHVLERDIDRRMDRTDDRPLVEGVIPVRRAIGFGLLLSAASVAVFLAFVNALAAALGVIAILFYSVGYTLILKPNTSQNIVIGGAVGAFPALIGWAAVEGTVGIPAIVLGAVIFLWTPAHFYNLALAYRDDYARVGIPMLPVVRGDAVTRRHVFLYLGATMLCAVLLGTAARLGWAYAATATVAGAIFLWAVVGLHRDRTERAAFRAFHASNAYLGSLLLVIAIDAIAI